MYNCSKEVVVVENLTKRFGEVVAVAGISFKVYSGEIFCIVGPNGSGKTTTLRTIVGLLKPEGGFVKVLGHDSSNLSLEVKRKIAYVPEDAGVPKGLTGVEYLEFVAEIYGAGEEAVKKGIQLSGLGEAIWKRVEEYSKGMKRRLLIASALAVEPELLVLDEPTAGLDVSYSIAIRDAIVSYVKSKGAAAIISSHNMLEVEHLCDRVVLLNRGAIVEEGSPKDIIARHRARNLEEVFVKVIGERA
ncbi:MAG: ABC transporter ATP-binding protein [Acidilobaceae archaeon]